MGGIIPGQPTIGGTYLVPGLQLEGFPTSGYFEYGTGIGLSLSANIVYYQSRDIYRVGSYVQPDGNFGALSTSPYASASAIRSYMDPSGKFLFVTPLTPTTGIHVYTISPTTGALTEITGSPFATTSPAANLTSSPDGNYLYLPRTDGAIGAYIINRATGALTAVAGSPFATGGNPIDVAVSTDSAFLYVADSAGKQIFAYSIGAGGVITAIAGSPFATSASVANLVMHPAGSFIYGLGGTTATLSSFSRNTITGSITELPASPQVLTGSPDDIAITTNGYFLYAAVTPFINGSVYAFEIDLVLGSLYAIAGSPFTTTDTISGITSDPTGTVFATAGSIGIKTYTIDQTSGALTFVANAATATSANKIAIDPTNKFAYALSSSGGTIYGFSTTPTIQLPLMEGTFDPSGAGNNQLNINGSISLNGAAINALPSGGAANAGKFLRLDTTGTGYVWDGVNTYIAVTMTANAGSFSVDDSADYIVAVSGTLTAQGALTASFSVPADPAKITFNNTTTGGFTVVLNSTYTIAPGVSTWYWNGSALIPQSQWSKHSLGVYASVSQALVGGTPSKVQLNVKEFDTWNEFDNVTNYRFTPKQAGYYRVGCAVQVDTSGNTRTFVYKNGTAYKNGTYGTMLSSSVDALVFLNGSTDYIEFYILNSVASNTSVGEGNTYCYGHFVE